LRKDGDCESGNLLVFTELHVEDAERPVVGRISNHERRSATRVPLLLGSGNAVALSNRGEGKRLVVHSLLGLGVVRRLRYQGHVGSSPHPQDDLSITERRVRRDETSSCQDDEQYNAPLGADPMRAMRRGS
jgi:hypothetical protein